MDASFVCVLDNGLLEHKTDADGANAILFQCPCGEHHNLIAFVPTLNAPDANAGLSSNGGRWNRIAGGDLDTLTLRPSIAVKSKGTQECWHGFITNGEVK